MKYAEWYVAALDDLLKKGGKEEDMETLVNEFNTPTEAGLKKMLEGHGPVTCMTCGEPMPINHEAKLDEEMTCETCVPKSPS